MGASKKIHCVNCNKKCSGNVLRYQDQYYHKQCFELEQQSSELSKRSQQDIVSSRQWAPESLQSSRAPRDLLHSTADSMSPEGQTTTNTTNSDNITKSVTSSNGDTLSEHHQRSRTMDGRQRRGDQVSAAALPKRSTGGASSASRSATLPHSSSSPANGFLGTTKQAASCAGCQERILDGQALIALDLHWHVWCFKCAHCRAPLHGEYVAKEGKAYCEKDYQRLFGVSCVYCKRFITGKVLQAGEAHHFHPSCARCSKCGDPFVPGEEMYLQGEVTWHPRCGPGPEGQLGLESELDGRSQYGRTSPYADSEAVGDLSRVYTISYLNADPAQGYLRRPVEPRAPKSPQFSRPVSASRASSRSGAFARDRSVPRGMYSVLSSIRSGGGGSSVRARSPSMQNEEAIRLAQFPAAQEPPPDALAKIERDDFPAPPFPYTERRSNQTLEPPARQEQREQQRSSRPRSREITLASDELNGSDGEPTAQVGKEEEELSKIANGIGKIFLQTLKERERLRAWKRANLDPRNASRTPSATRELPARLRYENPTAASPSRDMDRPRHWDELDESAIGDHSPTRTRSSLGKMSASTYGYKVVQSNRATPKPGYGLVSSETSVGGRPAESFAQQQAGAQSRTADLLSRAGTLQASSRSAAPPLSTLSAHLRRSMPNVHALSQLHADGPPKLYPYHLLATSNYRLPPDVDRCHLERHLSGEEFQYIFHCDRLDFYRLPEWKRNELKRRAKLF